MEGTNTRQDLDDAKQVRVERVAEAVGRNREHVAVLEQQHGRIVHENVDSTDLLRDGVVCGLDAGALRDVHAKREGAIAGAERVGRSPKRSLVPARHDDAQAAIEELPGRLQPEPPVRAGHQRHAPRIGSGHVRNMVIPPRS